MLVYKITPKGQESRFFSCAGSAKDITENFFRAQEHEFEQMSDEFVRGYVVGYREGWESYELENTVNSK